jgi:hypothetical protein
MQCFRRDGVEDIVRRHIIHMHYNKACDNGGAFVVMVRHRVSEMEIIVTLLISY